MTNAPTRAVDRQHFVDVLRGFALLGILVVNVEFLMHPAEVGWAGFDSTIDSIVKGTVIALGQAKVYPIFATLFGYGLALQLQRAPDDLWPRHRRRMLILAALGVLHGIFFFVGDILLLYACVGLLAFRFRDWPTARLLRLAGIVYAIATTIWLLLGAVDRSGLAVPALDPDYVSALESGSFLDVAVAQFPIWLVTALVLFVIQGPTVFVSYCLGIALGRTTWLSAPEAHPDIIRRVLLWFPLGLAGSVFAAWLTLNSASTSTLGFALGFVFGPLVAAGYVAGLAVFVGNKDSLASKLLRPTGRVSLTVYLFESVVVAGLTYGYGFGLLGELGPLGNVGTAVAVWATLSAAAVLWIRRYRFGPIEWALRSLTYRRRQPLHR